MKATHLSVLLLLAASCATGADPDPGDPGNQPLSVADTVRSATPAFATCGGSFTPARSAGWRHWTSRIVSALGGSVHSANDFIVAPGADAVVEARFAYGGVLSKELENEWVWVFIDDGCTSWRYAGYALTSDEGRATFHVRAPLAPGRYDLRMEVVGDATWVPLTLWVMPAGTHVAVFDLDGTLTTDDAQVFEQILLGHTPDAYPSAADLTWAEASRGEIGIYLTGRPEILAGASRGWLSGQGFAPGALHLAGSAGDVLPTNSGVGNYKLAFLHNLESAGLIIDDAFGNATTDVFAYAGAGVATDRTWIIGSNAGAGGTEPVSGSWADVADSLASEPSVPQPFTF